MSAESGIATFRDAGGLWDRFDPTDVATPGGWIAFLVSKPWEGVEFLRGIRDAFGAACPNAGHEALAGLERIGRLGSVITQNVDGLHQEAGSRDVIELHGSFGRRRCMGCGEVSDSSRAGFLDDLDQMIAKLGSYLVAHPAHLLRRCDCGGLLRADVVMFGEPVQGLVRAQAEAGGADVLLVCGTSGMVYPAAGLVSDASARGACVVEVNPEPTELTDVAEIVLRGPAGRVLPELRDAVAMQVFADV